MIQLYIGGSSFHLCNAYIPNAFQLEYHHLDKLYSQISGAVLIVGDFNSHNLIWGSGRTDRRGKIVGDFVNNEDLMVLNNCRKSTYFNVAAELNVHRPKYLQSNLARYLKWNVMEDLHNSDHYPITLTYENSITPEDIYVSRWIFKKAN